jgi:hypothetical protein
MDYKKTALEGAVVGAALSLFFFKGGRGLKKAAKYGVLGAGAAMAGTYLLLDKAGIGLLSKHVTGADPFDQHRGRQGHGGGRNLFGQHQQHGRGGRGDLFGRGHHHHHPQAHMQMPPPPSAPFDDSGMNGMGDMGGGGGGGDDWDQQGRGHQRQYHGFDQYADEHARQVKERQEMARRGGQ